ncbi:MAG: 2-vinyl bacteriochlorophyllide hydratase, partial [Gemmatimonadota bacterium]
VIALHTAYMATLFVGFLSVEGRLILALVAYAAYGVNAAQFLLKLRRARLQASPPLRTA